MKKTHADSTSRTSAELDELFERKVKPWRFHKTKTALQAAVESQMIGLEAEAQQ
jgi:hypothetical protein